MHPDKQAHHWSYSDDDVLGPNEWPKYFKTGNSQSPINIIVEPCYLHSHSIKGPLAKQQQNAAVSLPRQLANKLVIGRGETQPKGVTRRDHLDSVGNDLPDYLDEHHSNRSPSTSSNNSAVSNESSSSNNEARLETIHSKSRHHHHNDHHQRRQQQQQGQHEGWPIQNTRYCGTSKKIFLGYPRYLNSVKLSNTGHGWQIDMPPELACHTLLTGPPLADREYRLAQFHCHWGEDCNHGSEHQVNGQSFSAEIHFVHWNFRQFKSIEEASKHRHGLAVLGVFVQALEGEQNRNKHLDKIVASLREVKDKPHDSTQINDFRLDLKKLFPSNRWNYATYEGSLTTPPLSESVDWLVFLQPITCSSSQIEQFRQIRCPSGTLIKNCRPVQPLNRRTVTIWTHHSD